ncbi:MAG: DUF2958 domain-containing protein [PVC group bacterium]|nr:DUF2958 domain-containing protein [PVC group bacterium]
MELLPKEIACLIPALYSQDGKNEDVVKVYVRLFTPDSDWSWYITEYDPCERLCYGLVDGFEAELGYFSLDELESVTGPLGLPVERDLYFTKTTLLKVRKERIL